MSTSKHVARCLACLCTAALLALANPCHAGSAKVENYSNNTIHVAVAYRAFKGSSNLAAEGWFTLRPNEVRTFSAADVDDLHLRIINDNGNEITFQNHNTFHSWPTSTQRFSVSKEPDDAAIRVLRWGANLENSRNANQNGPFPQGWQNLRYFRIGWENARLELKP